MKICFLGPAGNYHIEKWCKWFSERGHDVDVISFSDGSIAGAHVHCLQAVQNPRAASEVKKIPYLFQGKKIKELVENIKPDVISVHFASCYGTAAALSGIGKYTRKPFDITPFGVDMELFSPDKRRRGEVAGDFVVGTVKMLSPKYGVDYLLKAAAIVRDSIRKYLCGCASLEKGRRKRN